jgi:dTDP-4-amino-4,6-dideoxygalactose transaminase
MMSGPIQFIDLAAQQARIRIRVDAAIKRTLDHGTYIMGPEVGELEARLAAFTGARHAIGCSNGTDAISLCLIANGVGPGDVVFCPSFTFAATAEAVALVGASPYFVDVDEETYTIDAESLKLAILQARADGLKAVGIITVDLFGQPADYDAVEDLASQEGLWLLCDAAQGFGATYKGRKAGSIGDMTTTSFFPAKPLGCYGDGGAIFTDDDDLASVIRSLLAHGKGSDKYDNLRIGMNGRLDTLQAGILIEKLAIFPDEIVARNRIARRYSDALGNMLSVPAVRHGCESVWAQYTVRSPGKDRTAIINGLKQRGVPTAVYYPKPLHQQTAYRDYPKVTGGLPVTERLMHEVFSLPMHPYLDEVTQEFIVDAVREVWLSLV